MKLLIALRHITERKRQAFPGLRCKFRRERQQKTVTMLVVYLIFAVVFLVFLIGVIIYLYPGSTCSTTVPGIDPSDPKCGNLADIEKAGSFHEFLVGLHKEHGDIVSFWMGEKLIISTASPELFKEQSKIFDRPTFLFMNFEALLTADSIQYANGADGRKRRNMYDKVYSHDMMPKYHAIFEENTLELCKKLSSVPPEEHLALSQYMFAIAIQGIAKASFGIFFNDDKEVYKLRQAYELCWTEMESRLTEGEPKPGSSRVEKFDKAKESITGILKQVIKKRLETPPSDGELLLIDALLESNQSEAVILADSVTYLIGGLHTTGLLLTWSLYFLATHQDVQEKLYKELKEKLGEKDISPANLPDLVYMRQVLDETMRCSILAPMAARCQEFDIELGGHKIPKGTPIVQALGVTLQDDKYWPLPNRFDPDRFNEENRKARPNFVFEPFGFAGKRKCPGYRFSYVEATVVLAILLRKFKFNIVPGQVVIPEFGLVTKPKDEIWVTIEKRK